MATNGNWEEMNPGCEQVAVGFTFEDRFHHTCISGSPTVNFCKHYSYFLLKVFFFPSNRKKKYTNYNFRNKLFCAKCVPPDSGHPFPLFPHLESYFVH